MLRKLRIRVLVMSEAEAYIEMCETALTDFEKGKDADQSVRALYNRLYYACFYAAKAALLSEGIDSGSHAGVADRVFTVLHKEKDLVSKEKAAALSKVQTKRDLSDYELEINESKEDLQNLEQDAKSFIEEMIRIAS